MVATGEMHSLVHLVVVRDGGGLGLAITATVAPTPAAGSSPSCAWTGLAAAELALVNGRASNRGSATSPARADRVRMQWSARTAAHHLATTRKRRVDACSMLDARQPVPSVFRVDIVERRPRAGEHRARLIGLRSKHVQEERVLAGLAPRVRVGAYARPNARDAFDRASAARLGARPVAIRRECHERDLEELGNVDLVQLVGAVRCETSPNCRRSSTRSPDDHAPDNCTAEATHCPSPTALLTATVSP